MAAPLRLQGGQAKHEVLDRPQEAWRTRREILPDPVQRLPDRPEKGRGRLQEARGALRGVDGGLQGAENRALKVRNYDPYSLKNTPDARDLEIASFLRFLQQFVQILF